MFLESFAELLWIFYVTKKDISVFYKIIQTNWMQQMNQTKIPRCNLVHVQKPIHIPFLSSRRTKTKQIRTAWKFNRTKILQENCRHQLFLPFLWDTRRLFWSHSNDVGHKVYELGRVGTFVKMALLRAWQNAIKPQFTALFSLFIKNSIGENESRLPKMFEAVHCRHLSGNEG